MIFVFVQYKIVCINNTFVLNQLLMEKIINRSHDIQTLEAKFFHLY